MKLKRSMGVLGRAIGFDSIISSIITVVLIAGVIIGIFNTQRHYVWRDIVRDSKGTYEYTSYNKKYVNEVDSEVAELYKNTRVLSGYSDLENLSLENYSTGNIMLYGWDTIDSKKLNESIDIILEDIDKLEERTGFKKKEKDVLIESLMTIRYFCNNQQVINRARLEMKLTGEVSQVNSSLNISIINDGGREYFDGYEEKLKELKDIFNSN